MIRGLYAAAASMLTASAREDVVAANLANLQTPGYKQVASVEGPLAGMTIGVNGTQTLGTIWLGDRIDKTATDWSEGSLRASTNPLAAALVTPGFFVVQTPGGVRYTRDGNFHLTPNGQLMTSSGYQVVGAKGPITVKGGGTTVRMADGGTIVVGGQPVARLQVMAAANPAALVSVGSGLWRAPAAAGMTAVTRPQVRAGMLEASNVSPVRQMVALLEVQRAYAGAQQMIMADNGTLNVAINQVGKVA